MPTLTFSAAEWGYATDIPDWGSKPDRITPEHTPDRRHRLAPGLGETIVPGVSDSSILGRSRGGYGFVRPWDENVPPQELKVQQEWQQSPRPKLDYYVALLNGSPCPDAVRIYYPERVFVTAKDENDVDLHRYQVLDILRKIGGIHAQPAFWEPCQMFHGLEAGGIPRFSAALRSDTDYGGSWFTLRERLCRDLPDGYEWNYMGGRYGDLWIDEPKEEKP